MHLYDKQPWACGTLFSTLVNIALIDFLVDIVTGEYIDKICKETNKAGV